MTQSDKNGLVAYLKVSKNASFKYLVCCSSPMVEAKCTKFHTMYNNSLPSRASTVEVATIKFPAILDSFYTEVDSTR